MAVPTLKRALGNRISTTFTGAISDSDLSITVADATSINASGGLAVIDEADSNKREYVYIESKSGNTLTIASGGRGLNGTSPVAHSSNATITDILLDDHINDFLDSFGLEHDSDGGHKQIDSAITVSGTAITSSNKAVDAITLETWIPSGETWTYASADDPTFTFTISGDKTTKYSAGVKIKLTQTTDKFFIITAVSYSAPNTTVTVYGGTDYDLANAAITSPYWSPYKAPVGFPLDPTKWTVRVLDTVDRLVNLPASGTYYNLNSTNIVIPIGIWRVSYQGLGYIDSTSVTTNQSLVYDVALSTSSSSVSDSELRSRYASIAYISASSRSLTNPFTRSKFLNLAAKTTYYLIASATGTNLSNIYFNNGVSPLIIEAVCAYL